MKIVNYRCDECGEMFSEEGTFHTEKFDVCFGCLKKIVDKHFEEPELPCETTNNECSSAETVPGKKTHKLKHPINWDKAREMREQGMTLVDVGKYFGVSASYIHTNTSLDKKKMKEKQDNNGTEKEEEKKDDVPINKVSDKKADNIETDPRKIDLGKAQALRNAKWPLHKIAEEMKTTVEIIRTNTYPPAETKSRDNEWLEEDMKRLGETDAEEIGGVM